MLHAYTVHFSAALTGKTTSFTCIGSSKVHPYVELVLIPGERFPDVKSVTTSTVVHGTHSPSFNESFRL